MVDPWEIDSSLVSSDGEVFAYPCHKNSGVAIILTEFLTVETMKGTVDRLVRKYHLN